MKHSKNETFGAFWHMRQNGVPIAPGALDKNGSDDSRGCFFCSAEQVVPFGLSLRHPTKVYEDLRRKTYFF
jgi:hypothetical protein